MPNKQQGGEIVNMKINLRNIAERSIKEREVQRAFFPVGLAKVRELGDVEAPEESDDETVDLAAGPIVVAINTNDIDRHDTIVDPTGADVNQFLKNPVLLYQHGCNDVVGDWVVGMVKLGEFTRDAITAELVFDLEGKLHGDENKLIGKELDRLYRKGWMRGVSIGFIANGYAIENVDGREVLRYTQWELVELSCVAVPSNPMALCEAVRSVTSPVLLDDLRSREVIETREVETDELPEHASKILERVLAGEVTINDARAKAGLEPVLWGDHRKVTLDFQRPIEIVGQLETTAEEREVVPVEWEAPYNLDAEFAGTKSHEHREAMSALVVRNGEKVSYEFPHHHADGRINWKMLAGQMARLLTLPLPLTPEQQDAAYDHLAEHYRELGVVVPEPGAKTADQAYDLALQGRMARLDKAGYAWLFVEAVEKDGTHYPGFVRIDDDAVTMIGTLPKPGRLTDSRAWGQRRELAMQRDEQLLEKLVRTQEEILDLQVRKGAKFSNATRTHLLRHAEQVEAFAKSISEGLSGLAESAAGLRSMVSADEDEEDKSVSGSQHANVGSSGSSRAGPNTTTPFKRPIAVRK
jgi:hypothetical protein